MKKDQWLYLSGGFVLAVGIAAVLYFLGVFARPGPNTPPPAVIISGLGPPSGNPIVGRYVLNPTTAVIKPIYENGYESQVKLEFLDKDGKTLGTSVKKLAASDLVTGSGSWTGFTDLWPPLIDNPYAARVSVIVFAAPRIPATGLEPIISTATMVAPTVMFNSGAITASPSGGNIVVRIPYQYWDPNKLQLDSSPPSKNCLHVNMTNDQGIAKVDRQRSYPVAALPVSPTGDLEITIDGFGDSGATRLAVGLVLWVKPKSVTAPNPPTAPWIGSYLVGTAKDKIAVVIP